MDVQSLREQIPSLRNLTYMNTGWSGPPPRRVADALKARVDLELEQGPTTAEVYAGGRQIQAQAREAAARLLKATTDEVLITRNTTEGLNIVLSGLDWNAGDEIVTCNLEHNSVLAPCWFIGKRYGVKVNVVSLDPHDSADTIMEKFEAALSPNTKLIFVSHIQYSTGLRMPAEALARLARHRGVYILLDGAQTAGHIRLDMPEQGFDFYSIPGQKWVLGYEGVGALYIRKELVDQVHPAHTGGRAVVQPVDPYEFQPSPETIEKFLGGSGSVPLQAAFLEAVNLIEEIGIGEIEARNLDLASRLKPQLAEIPGVKILSPAEPRDSTGLVSFAVAGQSAESVVERLWSNDRIVVRDVHYPEAVRASLHFFNTEDEVDQLAQAVGRLA